MEDSRLREAAAQAAQALCMHFQTKLNQYRFDSSEDVRSAETALVEPFLARVATLFLEAMGFDEAVGLSVAISNPATSSGLYSAPQQQASQRSSAAAGKVKTKEGVVHRFNAATRAWGKSRLHLHSTDKGLALSVSPLPQGTPVSTIMLNAIESVSFQESHREYGQIFRVKTAGTDLVCAAPDGLDWVQGISSAGGLPVDAGLPANVSKESLLRDDPRSRHSYHNVDLARGEAKIDGKPDQIYDDVDRQNVDNAYSLPRPGAKSTYTEVEIAATRSLSSPGSDDVRVGPIKPDAPADVSGMYTAVQKTKPSANSEPLASPPSSGPPSRPGSATPHVDTSSWRATLPRNTQPGHIAAARTAVSRSYENTKTVDGVFEAEVTGEPWYHGEISSVEAGRRVEEYTSGAYLVRKSETQQGQFVLCVNWLGSAMLLRLVASSDGSCSLCGLRFRSMKSLIAFFAKTPFPTTPEQTGQVVNLTFAVPVSRFE